MPFQIDIANVPNQSIEVELEQSRYTLRFFACFDCMAVDVSRDGVQLVTGARVVSGGLLIPAQYQFYGRGNFMILTANDDLPYYDQFGVTQSLFYFTAEEMAAAYGGT